MGDVSNFEKTIREAIRGSIKYQEENKTNWMSFAVLRKLDERKEKTSFGHEQYLFIEGGNYLKFYQEKCQRTLGTVPNKVVFLKCDDKERLALIDKCFYLAAYQKLITDTYYGIKDQTNEQITIGPFGLDPYISNKHKSFGDDNLHTGIALTIYEEDISKVNKKIIDTISIANDLFVKVGQKPLPEFPGLLFEKRIIEDTT